VDENDKKRGRKKLLQQHLGNKRRHGPRTGGLLHISGGEGLRAPGRRKRQRKKKKKPWEKEWEKEEETEKMHFNVIDTARRDQ